AVFDPTTSGPTPRNKSEIADDMRASGAAKQGVTYSLGQWQQELATKNDPRDQWGLNDARKDVARAPLRAPRMSELRTSAPRSVNVSEAVDKIFAKKVEEPAQKPGAAPAPGATPGPATAPAAEPAKPDSAAAADVGALPYWPDLVQDYNFDLGAMADARKQVAAYKAEQQKALATARGDLKKRAAEIRAEAAARKAPVVDNQTGLDKDKTNLDEANTGSKQQLDNDAKADAKRGEADGPAGEGADAAEQAAAAEPPPAKGWWGKIKAAANWLLKNTLGRAMKFVTDAITNVVLLGIKTFMGLDVKEMANYGMQTTDDGKAKAADGTKDTATAGTTNTKVEADIAVEDMTLGQRIQAGEKNLKEATDFEAAIDAQEKSIQAEIKACNDFIAQVKAQFDTCKAEAEKAKAVPPEDHSPPQPQPAATDAATPTPADAKPDGGDPDMESKLNEARTLCTGSIDTEIANLKALHAKGSSILMQDAGHDAASIAEAERLSQQVEVGALKAAVGKLEALKSKAGGGNQDAVVAVAHEIETACHDGTDAVISAYVSAEHTLLAMPPPPPTPAHPPSGAQPHP
ncbi:MAG TPA: hypothetical protein VK601_27350, partial [Kofleriaceae bacterium]|nr:hypothetical protein [Kofleriaceae bacterium]